MEIITYNNSCIDLLQRYFDHPLTPENNKNHKIFKTDLYDGVNGVMFLILDHGEIVSTFGAIKVDMDSKIQAIKMPHRLHVRSDYTAYHHRFVDDWFEPQLYKWIESVGIRNIYQTMNFGNERAMWLSSLRHRRRRRYHVDSVNSLGQQFIMAKWQILPYLVYEKHTWQYAYWASLDNIVWQDNWRQIRLIDQPMQSMLDQKFHKDASGSWLL